MRCVGVLACKLDREEGCLAGQSRHWLGLQLQEIDDVGCGGCRFAGGAKVEEWDLSLVLNVL